MPDENSSNPYDILKKELEIVIDLARTLEKEERLLSSRDLEKLPALTEKKNYLLEKIGYLEKYRTEAMVQPNPGDIFVMSCDNNSQGLKIRLREALYRCQKLNQKNSRLNQIGQQHAQQLLRILKGEPIDDPTYEKLGHSPPKIA